MKGRITERLIAVLVVLFLLVTFGYHAVNYYYKPISTETVYEYNVSRSITTTGIAFREEEVLDQSLSGVENYLVEDATRVAVGETVAEFYRSSGGDRNMKRARELNQEIQMLVQAQDTTLNNVGNADIYNMDIKEQLSRIDTMSSVGRYADVTGMRQSLSSLLNKKQIATGKVTDFQPRIDQLERELSGLSRTTSGESVTTADAPVAGYFSRSTDGFEATFTPALLDTVGVGSLADLLAGDYTPISNNKVGKMVMDQNWYLAVCAPRHEVEWVKAGQTADMQFDQIGERIPATVVRVIEERDNDTIALILRSDRMTEELINIRKSGVILHFEQYSGLRINAESIRFVDNQRGVYILDNQTVRFKLVDAVYEESTFLLSRPNYSDSVDNQTVRLFDQVITKGNDLYDKKVIQDY